MQVWRLSHLTKTISMKVIEASQQENKDAEASTKTRCNICVKTSMAGAPRYMFLWR